MTKIVCTLGPSTDSPGPVSSLVANGMHVARLNFSHAGDDYSYPASNVKLVRGAPGMHSELGQGASVPLPPNVRAILVDTKGPEIRTGPPQGGADVADIAVGATVELTVEDVSSEPAPGSPDGPHRVQVDYESIGRTAKVGGQVLLDDGLLALEVTGVDADGGAVTTVALNGGPIKRSKGVNLPDTELDLPALTDKDKRDMRWACEVGADFVAASFIRTAGNVRSVKAYLDRCIADLPAVEDEEGRKPPIRPLVISKIESKEGVDNFPGILAESDGIMVARGDLGVEIPFPKVFAAQKMMVSACNRAGKPVIVATQMLDSMQRNPRPTRAEVTDVGTAVLDGADAVMLSGETAAGMYPIESLKAMTSVVTEADAIVDTGRARPPPIRTSRGGGRHTDERLAPNGRGAAHRGPSRPRRARGTRAPSSSYRSAETGRAGRAAARVVVRRYRCRRSAPDPRAARRLRLRRALTPRTPSERLGSELQEY